MSASLTIAKSPPAKRGHGARRDLLRRFVAAYWLRPENALWMALRSEALSRAATTSRSLDLACGDGVFSFLHFGGEFAPAWDVFAEGSIAKTAPGEKSDAFDHVTDRYHPLIQRRPPRVFDVGCDLKDALLTKARRLDFYRWLVRHDANGSLPFARAEFNTVYCNAAYWVREIDAFLAETCRVTHPTGRVILHVKLDSLRRYNFEFLSPRLDGRFLKLLARGRLECWPSLASREQWEERFDRAGLDIKEATPFVTRTHAYLWDVGLRPIAPLLVRMANSLTDETRSSIKRDWVDLMMDVLTPFFDPGLDLLSGSDEPAEMQYVLAPR